VPALAGAAAIAVAVRLAPPPPRPADVGAERLANRATPKRTEAPSIKREAPLTPSPPRPRRERTLPSEPPAELAARPDLFVNLPLLRNLEKLALRRHPDHDAGRAVGGCVERMTAPTGAAVLAVLLAASPVAAQWYARDWQQLSPEEQRRAWENYRRYQQLPEQRRQQYENRYQRFQTLPPQEQDRLRQNYESYRRQDPASREQFNEKYRRWKQRGK
jgi:hypothetical protein